MKLLRDIYLIVSLFFIVFFGSHYYQYQFNKKRVYIDKSKEELIDYFNEIALGFEYGSGDRVTRKWETSIKIFSVIDNDNEELNSYFERSISSINNLIGNDKTISIVKDSTEANAYIFLCSYNKLKSYDGFHAKMFRRVDENTAGFVNVLNADNRIFKSYIFIDTNRSLLRQKGVLLEELTQSLGLGNDSHIYSNSIFYQHKIDKEIVITEFSELDKKLIKLLYHPKMKVGLNRLETDKIIRDILDSEEI